LLALRRIGQVTTSCRLSSKGRGAIAVPQWNPTMIDIRPVVQILGWIACSVALALLLPALADLSYGNPDWHAFLVASLLAGFVGLLSVAATRTSEPIEFDIRQAFLLTIVGWIVVALLGAVPFLGLGIGFTDAVFESMSGITTTGSTVLTGLDHLPPGILLWRALLQWIGGIGIIALAIMILPFLRVGGMQLFLIEHSVPGEEKVFTAFRTIVALFLVYVALTALCILGFIVFGMTVFDAVTHAMATVSTGGYSTHDTSFAYFKSPALHWIATLFMLCGSVPFYLYLRTVHGRTLALFGDQQVRGFLIFVTLASVAMAVWLDFERDVDLFDSLTLTAFNIVSIVTTTGFATDDYTAWGPGAVGVFLVLMFVGGCSGSTAGAIKIYRFQILLQLVRAHVKRLVSPHRVVPLRYNGKALPEDVPYSILAFLVVFVATIALFTMALSLMELDIVTAFSASVTAICNVGPGFGTIIGPSGNFELLPDAAKWILTVAMLAGRLEVLALLVAFDPDFWRR
jgi:trk system potassium uptake protein TrkH